MFKVITRGFYGLIIAGLLSLQIQAASTAPDPAGACGGAGGSSVAAVVQPAEASALIPFPRSMDRMAYQPPASIEEQIAAYGAPSLMGKVIQGCAFVSPVIEGSLNRDLLNRLYGQMLDLHKGAGIKMEDFYVFGLRLAILLDNPDLRGKTELQDRFECVKDWYTSQDWLEYPLGKEPSLPKGKVTFPREFKRDALVIFDPRGHFDFHVLDKFLLGDYPYLAVLGFGGSVHGNSINSPATIYLHDLTHADEHEGSLTYQPHLPLLSRFLLGPIFAQWPSLSGLESRQIEYVLYHALHENPDWGLNTILVDLTKLKDAAGESVPLSAVSQKELGRFMIQQLQRHASEIGNFELGLYFVDKNISPSLQRTAEVPEKSLELRVDGEHNTIHGILNKMTICGPGRNLGTCEYAFSFPTTLESYTFTFREATPADGLTSEDHALYDAAVAALPREKVLEGNTTHFRQAKGDEVKSLGWVNAGKWTPKTVYAWDDMVWHSAEMAKVYGVLLAKGLELWSDAPVPAEILAPFTESAA